MSNFKTGALVSITVFLTVFALQNMAKVDLFIGFWTIESRRIVVIVFSFACGFAVSSLLRTIRSQKNKAKSKPENTSS